MVLSVQTTLFSPEQYLSWEASQLQRHEYVNGEVLAMADSGDRHSTTCANLIMALRTHLAGSLHRTYAVAMKLHIQAANSYFYPDLLVTCSPDDAQDRLIKREPSLVIEVLSPGTAAYDRGAKFSAYRQLPSLQEYALIDIDTRSSDVYRKGADGLWVLHPFGEDESVRFASVDLTITAASLFAEVDEDAAI
ncbi:MAG: Uma2 family endonuclease [Pseudomonadota bacterium]